MSSITINDLGNAAKDVEHIANVALSSEATATDRLGNAKQTVKGAIDSIKAFNNRGGWAASIVYVLKDVVSVAGAWYVCVVAHTSSAAFATDSALRWRIYQGLTKAELASLDSDLMLAAGKGFFPRTAANVPFYGDSFTNGVGATVPANAYRSLVASRLGVNDLNHSVSGGSIMDWIRNTYVALVADDGMAFILPGFNDARFVGSNLAQQQAYQLALYAAAAFLAIPESQKIKGNSSGMSYSGTWSESSVSPYGRVTSELNAAASFSVAGDAVYIGTVQQLSNQGIFNVQIDGVDKGNFSMMQSVGNSGNVSNLTYMPMLIRISGLGDGVHSVVCRNVGKESSSLNSDTYIDWVAGSSSRAKTSAKVFIGNTCRMTSAGYATGAPNSNRANPEVTRQFCQMAEQVCADLAMDGLDVCYVDTSGAYNPETEVDSDTIHPSDAGHASLASAFVAAVDARQRPAFASLAAQVRRYGRTFAALVRESAVVHTWTPILAGFGSPGSNTYSTQIGFYRVSGGICTASFELAISAKVSAMVGPICVTLPLPAVPVAVAVGSIGERSGIVLSPDCSGLYIEAIPGDDRAVVRQSANNPTELPTGNIYVGARIRGTITYLV